MGLEHAINPKFGVYWHVHFLTDLRDPLKGRSRGQITASRYNPILKENIYFIDVYSTQKFMAPLKGMLYVTCEALKIVRLESQLTSSTAF